MSVVIDFLKVYWKESIPVFCAFLTLFFSILRKTKIKKIDSSFEQAIEKLPRWILTAELVFSQGNSKKEFVIDQALKFISQIDHRDYSDVSIEYSDRISDALENILSTPTKKGEKSETINEKIR